MSGSDDDHPDDGDDSEYRDDVDGDGEDNDHGAGKRGGQKRLRFDAVAAAGGDAMPSPELLRRTPVGASDGLGVELGAAARASPIPL